MNLEISLHDWIASLPDMPNVNLVHCTSLTSLPDLQSSTQLNFKGCTQLNLKGCPDLTSLPKSPKAQLPIKPLTTLK